MPAMADHGYAFMAAWLTQEFGIRPGLSRQQVYAWASRRTRNAAGQPFPAGPPFTPREVVAWYAAGLPERFRWQGREPGGRPLANREYSRSIPG